MLLENLPKEKSSGISFHLPDLPFNKSMPASQKGHKSATNPPSRESTLTHWRFSAAKNFFIWRQKACLALVPSGSEALRKGQGASDEAPPSQHFIPADRRGGYYCRRSKEKE